jgi:hypothetical protein
MRQAFAPIGSRIDVVHGDVYAATYLPISSVSTPPGFSGAWIDAKVGLRSGAKSVVVDESLTDLCLTVGHVEKHGRCLTDEILDRRDLSCAGGKLDRHRDGENAAAGGRT